MVYDIILLLIIAITVLSFRKQTNIKDNYLDKGTTNRIKGLACIFVIIGHFQFYVGEQGILQPFMSGVGLLSVGLFFFISGYGVQRSNLKNNNYVKGFLKKRILGGVVIPYLFYAIIYWIVYWIIGNRLSVTDIIQTYIGGSPYIKYSWYMINIFIFYVAFWIMIKYKKHIIIGMTICFFVYSVICMIVGYGNWWYNASILFVIGIICATYREKMICIIEKYRGILLSIFIPVYIYIYIYSEEIHQLLPIYGTYAVMNCIKVCSFSLVILTVLTMVKLEGRVLNYLGMISLEIYMTQGIIFLILEKTGIDSNIFGLLVIIGTILLASIIYWLKQGIRTGFRIIKGK